jgi:hypothetical protein
VPPNLVDERGVLIEMLLAALTKTTPAIVTTLLAPLGIRNSVELVVTEHHVR